ncbi:uncharacterized protein [Venturia canescens]|uniref:uncharacterized protein n=1 Tax=Venturia canescens TaxID=32260 RepID=UPI001C9D4485|nr:uncharacterized protein LOC122413307 [Venturia canescens]
MSSQFDKYHVYGGTIKRLVRFTGFWPNPNPSFLYRLLPVVHGLAALLMCSATLNFCHQHNSNLHLFLKGLGLALSFLTIIQKMSCLTFYRERLMKLHTDLAISFDLDMNDTQLRPILLSPLQSFYSPSLILSMVTYTTIGMYWITPILLIVIQLAHGVDHVKYLTPFPTAYPWRIDANTWLYLSMYAFEIYGGIVASFTSSFDALFGYYVFQITGQLRTLSYRITNLKSNENYRKVISECISRHQVLTKCQDYLEQVYGPIVIWMLVSNAMVMCTLIYQAAHVSPEIALIIVFYMVLKSVQTLTYGWFGSFLESEKNKFREAIYGSDWAGSGEKRLMTDVLIMMTYKPFVLKACCLSNISIDMFIPVCNTAVSYYLLLQTLEETSHKR